MKRAAAICLTLALWLSFSGSLAESKTTSDVVSVTSKGNVIVVAPPTAESEALLAEIVAFAGEGNAVAAYFGDEAVAAMAALLPATVAPAELKMDEFFRVAVRAAVEEGVLQATLRSAASYAPTDAVAMLAGVIKNGETTWTVAPCRVDSGRIIMDLSAELLAQMRAGVAVLAVLSNKH